MDDIQLDVVMLARKMGMNIEELADACGINKTHLKNVSAGVTRMTAEDLKRLSITTGVPTANIKTA